MRSDLFHKAGEYHRGEQVKGHNPRVEGKVGLRVSLGRRATECWPQKCLQGVPRVNYPKDVL